MSTLSQHIEPLWPSITTVSVIVISVIIAWFGFVDIATYVFAAYAFVMGVVRVIMRDTSPWKVRSAAFDAFISFGLAIGLVVTYVSIIFI